MTPIPVGHLIGSSGLADAVKSTSDVPGGDKAGGVGSLSVFEGVDK